MKLSKKGAAIQQAIHDALASGKALGGLLVGFAATVTGCGDRHSSAHTMGRFPDPSYQENAKNEDAKVFVTEGEMPEAEEVPAQEPEPSKTNAVREVQGKDFLLRGEPLAPPSQSNAVNEDRNGALSVKGRIQPKK